MDNLGIDSWKGQEILLFFKNVRLVLGPTQLPDFFSVGTAVLSLSWCVKLTTHLYTFPWLRISGTIFLLPYLP